MFNFAEEIKDFHLCYGLFLSRKFKLISEKFKICQPNKIKRFLCPRSHYKEVLSSVALESERCSAEWKI